MAILENDLSKDIKSLIDKKLDVKLDDLEKAVYERLRSIEEMKIDELMKTFESSVKEKLDKLERDVPTLETYVRNNFKQEITDEMHIHVIKQRVAIEKGLMIEIDKKTTQQSIMNIYDPILNKI